MNQIHAANRVRAALLMLFAAATLVALAWIARTIAATGIVATPAQDSPDGSHLATGTAIGVLLLGSWLVGKALTLLELPKITGFLIFGVCIGPSALGIIDAAELKTLQLVNDLAIALIALAAGGKLSVIFLKDSLPQILILLIAQTITVLGVCSAVAYFVLRTGNILPELDNAATLWIAAVVGVVSVALSPAVFIAMLNEIRANERFSNLALALIICTDIALIVLFTLVIGLAAPAVLTSLSSQSDPAELTRFGPVLLSIAQHLIGSVIFGAIVGAAMAFYAHAASDRLTIVIPLACFGITLLSNAMGLETLLVALVAGVLMRNVWATTSVPVFEAAQRLSLPVYCVFFAVAGCKVQLDALASAWHWALAFCGARALAIIVSITLGARAAGVDPSLRRWLWTPLIAQAGVSVALVGIVHQTFASTEGIDAIYTILMAMIAINELLGPVLCKLGLERTPPDTPATT